MCIQSTEWSIRLYRSHRRIGTSRIHRNIWAYTHTHTHTRAWNHISNVNSVNPIGKIAALAFDRERKKSKCCANCSDSFFFRTEIASLLRSSCASHGNECHFGWSFNAIITAWLTSQWLRPMHVNASIWLITVCSIAFSVRFLFFFFVLHSIFISCNSLHVKYARLEKRCSKQQRNWHSTIRNPRIKCLKQKLFFFFFVSSDENRNKCVLCIYCVSCLRSTDSVRTHLYAYLVVPKILKKTNDKIRRFLRRIDFNVCVKHWCWRKFTHLIVHRKAVEFSIQKQFVCQIWSN